MEAVTAPCSHCLRKTRQNVLHSVSKELDEHGENVDVYKLLQCAGCHNISMAKYGYYWDGLREWYYPPPAKRRKPSWWQLEELPHKPLLDEIYQAMRGGQYRLAAMGMRSFLERMMISKVGDQGTFGKNMSAFSKQGYISPVQYDAMKDIVDVGHATMHRRFSPNEEDLSKALDVTENIFAAIYVNEEAAASVADRIPPRSPRPKSS